MTLSKIYNNRAMQAFFDSSGLATEQAKSQTISPTSIFISLKDYPIKLNVIGEDLYLSPIQSRTTGVLPSFISLYEGDLGELEEEMRRAFYGQFRKDINVKSEIGVMLPSSFDGMDSDELTVEQIVHGPPEYSRWENRD